MSSKLHRADTKVFKSLSTDPVLTKNEVRYYLPVITPYLAYFRLRMYKRALEFGLITSYVLILIQLKNKKW